MPNNAKMHNFDAVVPKRVSVLSRTHNIEWKYPWSGEEIDMASGLIKKAYPTKEPNRWSMLHGVSYMVHVPWCMVAWWIIDAA